MFVVQKRFINFCMQKTSIILFRSPWANWISICRPQIHFLSRLCSASSASRTSSNMLTRLRLCIFTSLTDIIWFPLMNIHMTETELSISIFTTTLQIIKQNKSSSELMVINGSRGWGLMKLLSKKFTKCPKCI